MSHLCLSREHLPSYSVHSLKEVSGKSDKKAESAEVLPPTQRKAMALVENALWKRVPFYLSRVRHQAVTSCITWLVLWSTKLPADPLGAAEWAAEHTTLSRNRTLSLQMDGNRNSIDVEERDCGVNLRLDISTNNSG